jgi:hypothetical protein
MGYVEKRCYKCGKKLKIPIKERMYGITVIEYLPDCGKHREEYERVKDEYKCYVDFLVNKKIKKRVV